MSDVHTPTHEMLSPHQAEIPLAVVHGAPITEVPKDLYIPPDALEVFLEAFEGPLDLLLYLIRRHNLDILDIPIAEITHQYMQYVELMSNALRVEEGAPSAPEGLHAGTDSRREYRFELVGEYLVMAAMLAEIKSRMLLPRREECPEEEDPRAELVRRLQEYERYKQAAEDINGLPQVGRDIFEITVDAPEVQPVKPQPQIDLRDLLFALKDVMARAEMFTHHHVQREPLSVRERMSIILAMIHSDRFTDFTAMFTLEEGRQGVVVTLLALLELIKESLIELVQTTPFGSIHVKAVA